ncbi:MAG: FAD-dependent oxidoreductase [Saccharospirillaceae bacterium]|nr:FAD-dependent oxidoreductase [Pseudomonadales bacterium]NRB79396.1 FAD-dependent oxidoreductase [Saccharospirillaceae bacterium]
MIDSIKTVAVVGAGLLGRMLVWQLSNKYPDIQITLFDKGNLRHSKSAANTAAGMISPLSELSVSERAIYDMGINALKQWPLWLDKIQQQTNQSVDYQATGSIVLAHVLDKSELIQFQQELDFKLTKHDLDSKPYQWLDKTQLQNKEAQLGQNFDEGLFLNDEAYIDNRALLSALLKFIEQSNIQVFENKPCKIKGSSVLIKNNEMKFDFVFDCRGVGSNIKNLRSVRGEVLHVYCPEVSIKHAIRFMHPRYKLYIVPKPNDVYVIGATEIESNDTSPISLQSMLELGSALYAVHPAFAEARILEIDTNLRPAMIDNNPVIQLDNNKMSINGLYRHGFLLLPEVLNTIIDVLENKSHQYNWMVKNV